MAVPEPIVEAEDLRKNFDTNPVLRGVSFVLAKGETLVVMGGSGAGKTVLLRLVAGLIRPDGGSLRVFGRNIENLSEEALLPLRRRMGYVFQSAALFDSLSVYENVAYPLREHTSLGEAEIDERVVRNLSVVGLSSDVLPLLPSELSGGMRKRVGIARALSVEPEMLLFDEPTGRARSDELQAGRRPDARELRGGVCDTAMVVTHDVELARTVADRVAVLIKGRFEALGPADEVLSGHNPAVQAFLAGSNVARAAGGAGR